MLGYEPELYRQITEMGWAGVLVPEEFGGSHLGYGAAGIILEQTGRGLASPLLTTFGATLCVREAGSEAQKQDWIPKLVSGMARAALAFDDGGHHDPGGVRTTAEQVDGGCKISGQKNFVADAIGASLFIVAATSADGLQYYLVPRDTEGLSCTQRHMIDFRGYSLVRFDDVWVPADARCHSGDLKVTACG